MTTVEPRAFLQGLFGAALDVVGAATCLPPHLPEPPIGGRTIVIGAGKASAQMARASTWIRRRPKSSSWTVCMLTMPATPPSMKSACWVL